MKRYNPKEIESKWQKIWEDQGIYKASDDSSKPKRYILEYFPYPSGAAMHVGHVRNYTIGDTISRFARMQGFNVLHPMGWDAFGLPAENFAIKNKISPRIAIDQNTGRFRKQLMQMGFSYDWSREIDSTDPAYYKWTQWFFLLLFKRGLAYQQESLQWWCPVDKTVLANEQVEAGKCWRCGSVVEKKPLKQWFFKITEYADRLLGDLDELNWSDGIKIMQRNWIGKSSGAEIDFKHTESIAKIRVFTTRPDTLFGATFLVLAPEHPLVSQLTVKSQHKAVEAYIKTAEAKSDIERAQTDREKTGVFTGSFALNPATKESIPIWVADYVMSGYGTGSIMAVPAHDERDYAFARKFDLPITRVIKNDSKDDECTTAEGIMMNSGGYDGMPSQQAREDIVTDLAKEKLATEKINYKIRDWLISRQRYWGAPIPIVHCQKCGPVAVPEDQLPVKLPELYKIEPSGDGRSPLAGIKEFVETECPNCSGKAQRETDTMDGFACSSWYFLRFADPHNDKKPFDAEKVGMWLPVDDYIGGAEHAVMHLLYARFWTKVMFDEGLIDFKEPFKTLRNQGMILAPDGQKMSKSKGNTIEPDELLSQGYGADAIRIMELFIGPWDQSANWSVEGMGGAYRFLQRIWNLAQEHLGAEPNDDSSQSKELERVTHLATKRVTQDINDMGFNTAISALMEYVNELYKLKTMMPLGNEYWQTALGTLIKLVAPFAPHLADELWSSLGNESSVHISEWPKWDEDVLATEFITIVIQVNGKVRASIEVAAEASEDQIIASAQANEKVAGHLADHSVKKSIYVPRKLVNFVI